MKRDSRFIKLMYMLLVMSLFLSTTTISIGFSPLTTQLYVDPAKVEWNPALGQTFKVNVSIADVTDLQSFDFKLYWNTTLLDLVEAKPQPFLKPLWIVTENEINETLGRYWLNITSLADPPGVNGSGPLVTLTFNMTYEPIWPENVTCALDLAETKLADSSGNLIPHDVYDGEYTCYSIPLLSITTTTDKPSYDINETIHIYGNLTLGYLPVPDGLVALEVDNPLNQIKVIRTLSTGTPPSNQTVEIIDVIPCGGPPNYNPRNWFYRGTLAYFNITIKNNDSESRRVLVTGNVYDVNLTTLGIGTLGERLVPGGSTLGGIFSFPIPDTASLGNASIYASALTDWPKDGGTAYCPEKSATFEIRESGGAGASTSSSQSSSSSPEGTYNLTFILGSGERLGNYTIYTSSNYTTQGLTQKATNNVTFKLGGPWDINGDGHVNIIDLVIVALAFESAAVDNPETPWDETENWNPLADLDGNGVINIIDLVIVAIHWTG